MSFPHDDLTSPPLPQHPTQSYSPYDSSPRPLPPSTVSFSDAAPPRGPNAAHRPVPASYSSYPETKSYSKEDPPDDPSPPILYTDSGTYGNSTGDDFKRKKSLIRPERERVDPGDRLFHYRQHAKNQTDVMASATGNLPDPANAHNRAVPQLRRGKSILAREVTEVSSRTSLQEQTPIVGAQKGTGFWDRIAPGPVDGWMIYCWILTCWVPPFIMRSVFGKRTPEAQRAWREKIGLIAIIGCLMAAVGFLTFGFTQTVCGTPSNRYHGGHIENGSLIMNGHSYDLSDWDHPAAGPFNGTENPLYMETWDAGGKDASFMFQHVNDHCLNIIKPTNDTGITVDSTKTEMGWYFPCNLRPQNGTNTVDAVNITSSYTCHTSTTARKGYSSLKISGQVYYTWDDVKNQDRNLAVYQSNVLDLDLLNWLQSSQTTWPVLFDYMRSGNSSYKGLDITMVGIRSNQQAEMNCLMDVITIGFIDSKSIGCVASDVVLYVSLVFIIGVVSAKFAMAVLFGWFLSWRLGNFTGETYAQRMARSEAIENWTDDIYRPAPSRYRPNVAKGSGGKNRGTTFLPSTSRFSKADSMMVTASRPATAYGGSGYTRSNTVSSYGGKGLLGAGRYTPPGSPMLHSSRSSNSLPYGENSSNNVHNSFSESSFAQPNNNSPFPLNPNVIPQPSADFEPFGFPLMQNILLVTAYSESIEGLRTTIDSLATTDYPNSHKVILVIADGMVRGSGSTLKTPDIVLGMMKDLIVPADQVEPHSYVAIADGHKRHNMAKVYAGFYDYDDDTVEVSKQQRVPIVLVAKVGNPLEAGDAKPGNRGKRDSQIVLMAFLQKVMFDERMTTFEYEFFNSLWRVTGVSPDRYEGVLCVDADTKVFPDSLTRMTAAFQSDGEIMGLCGETKIANKSETWVTMIQVFEYYISHHQTKAFEAVFGGVTCLPGCFSMYRIKASKGDSGYWVPILANPDIVEHYSENVVDTLHKKNLLLLGEDRYLSTLMLKTFPKRKMVFIPQAVCKTVVPDTFRVLLSQRRRWINSTIHNLFELLFVNDLCGTFCFSMQFVVFMELVGTLVLPAAIAFTMYIIIIAIIPSMTTPVLSLILLAIVLGLPGLLIVVTSRKVAYIGWMLIYLCSLPIWNAVLPSYAYWHFDDFSWGETRKVESDGPKKEEVGHGDKDGEFDSSSIVMKRWAEFERERRWKSGTSSPRRTDTRYSMASTAETSFENYHYHGSRPSPSLGSGLIDGLLSPGGGSTESYHSNSTGPFQDQYSHSSHQTETSSPVEYEAEQMYDLQDQGYLSQSTQQQQERVRRVARNAQRRQSGNGSNLSNVASAPPAWTPKPNSYSNSNLASGYAPQIDRSQQ